MPFVGKRPCVLREYREFDEGLATFEFDGNIFRRERRRDLASRGEESPESIERRFGKLLERRTAAQLRLPSITSEGKGNVRDIQDDDEETEEKRNVASENTEITPKEPKTGGRIRGRTQGRAHID